MGGDWLDVPEGPLPWQGYRIPSLGVPPGDEDAHVRAWRAAKMHAIWCDAADRGKGRR